jgi:hypothetical protein
MPYTEDVSRGAACCGSISKLQWLLDELQCPQAGNLDSFAVHARTTDMLKWLKHRGCVFSAYTCAAAAKSLQAAHMLQILHSEGIPLDVRTIEETIACHDLPLLQWLCEHGGPLSKLHPQSYRPLQDLQVLDWLHSKGCPCDYNYLSCMAASCGYVHTLQWIKDNGVVDWSPAVLSECLKAAASYEKLDTAKVRAALTTSNR